MSEGNGKRGPKAYKVFDHVKEKVETLFKESGIEFEGDFLEQMASVYELNQLKTGVGAGYQKQISMLEYHTKHIVDSFVSLIQNEASDRLHITEEHEEKLGKLSLELSAQQDEINSLNSALKGSTEIIAKQEKELEDRDKLIIALQKSAEKDEQILAENKERMDRLSKMLSDNNDKVNRANEIEEEFTELTELTKKLENDLLNAEKSALEAKQQYEEELKRKDIAHQEQLMVASERAEIASEKAVVKIQRELTEQAEIDRRDANAEIRRLYAELNDLRKQVADAGKPKPRKAGGEEK
ncbi:hypothetical protein ASD24_24445 [Paenibacillus sp. Root52]|uniref:hypothetical protein n=1 Tax=Paenibacillus sp. Root52 TaxID=1736552 RepID=UPI0006F722EF|nr:hypothetical protein [Paenibacillus sp. Root52]KQY90950.1 hypothetical protein ASD24_24445 [Paenibacillus sp. Root52]